VRHMSIVFRTPEIYPIAVDGSMVADMKTGRQKNCISCEFFSS
jgi:hypothetical protein